MSFVVEQDFRAVVQMVRTIPELPVPMEVTQVLPAPTEMVLVVAILTPADIQLIALAEVESSLGFFEDQARLVIPPDPLGQRIEERALLNKYPAA